MWVGQSCLIALQEPGRRIVILRRLRKSDDGVGMLDREDHFFGWFINSDTECAMRRVQHPSRRNVSLRIAIENNEVILGIVVHGEDVAGLRIDVDPAIQLEMSLRSSDEALRLG